MEIKNKKFLTDAKGRQTAVVLSIKDYQKLLKLAQDVKDAAYIRHHRHEKLIPMAAVHKNLKAA